MNGVLLICSLISLPPLLAAVSRVGPGLTAPLLLLASLAFYAFENPGGMPLLLLSILGNFWVAGRIAASRKTTRGWLSAGIVADLLPLIFYKYLHHSSGMNEPAGLLVVFGAVPLGLSFYTFMQISCLVDVYRGRTARLNLLQHALYTCFLAQIPAGPISQYRTLAPQIAALGRSRVSAYSFAAGTSLFVLGLGKKIVLAGNLAWTVNLFYDRLAAGTAVSASQAWLISWTFLLQLYFDFSGYTDMALGFALCCGIQLPPNFNSPLKSISGSEFVDRWHMSLVGWIREYLFQPIYRLVAKLPTGPGPRRRTIGWAAATIVSMAIIGAWHGSQLVFVLEGTLGGLLLVARQLGSTGWWSRRQSKPGMLRRVLSHLVHLTGLSLLVTPLRARSTAMSVAVLQALFGGRSSVHGSVQPTLLPRLRPAVLSVGIDHTHLVWLVLATLIVFLLPNTMQMFSILPEADTGGGIRSRVSLRWRPTSAWGFAVGGLLVLAFYFGGVAETTGFIYAQF